MFRKLFGSIPAEMRFWLENRNISKAIKDACDIVDVNIRKTFKKLKKLKNE